MNRLNRRVAVALGVAALVAAVVAALVLGAARREFMGIPNTKPRPRPWAAARLPRGTGEAVPEPPVSRRQPSNDVELPDEPLVVRPQQTPNARNAALRPQTSLLARVSDADWADSDAAWAALAARHSVSFDRRLLHPTVALRRFDQLTRAAAAPRYANDWRFPHNLMYDLVKGAWTDARAVLASGAAGSPQWVSSARKRTQAAQALMDLKQLKAEALSFVSREPLPTAAKLARVEAIEKTTTPFWELADPAKAGFAKLVARIPDRYASRVMGNEEPPAGIPYRGRPGRMPPQRSRSASPRGRAPAPSSSRTRR